MSILKSDDNRVLAPAWFKSDEAIYSAELRSLVKNKTMNYNPSSLEVLHASFIERPTFELALEILSLSYTESDIEKAQQAASFIIESKKVVPVTLTEFCKNILSENNKNTIETKNTQAQISVIKKWLKENPNDCLSWIDLSRLYMSIGQINQAERSILIGLGLSNDNRWVTRVSSRFFFNIGSYERSHDILIRHPNINSDPWLLASELAISSSYGRNSRYWSSAKKALKFGYSECHTSELQSSIGTLELKSGSIKKAKNHFGHSLAYPNGNIFAQAKWAERKGNIKGLVPHEALVNHKRAFEAKYREAYYNQEMKLALDYAKEWLDEEPFNSQPAIHASYVASLLDDYKQTMEISKKGLLIDPSDETLRLNLIFSSISQEHLESGEISIESYNHALDIVNEVIKKEDKDTYGHAFANLGLLHYKNGELEKGKNYYEIAVEQFKKTNHPSAVLAELNHLREALISNAPWKEDLFVHLELMSTSGGFWREPCAPFYLNKLQKIRTDASKWGSTLSENDLVSKVENKRQIFPAGTFDFSRENPTIWIPAKKNPEK
jgi:tetratricopeptide (TPR) repeat protein